LCLLSLILVLGCRSRETYLRPPKNPETFGTVPDEQRYQKPPEYPKEALDLKRQKTDVEEKLGGSGAGFKGAGAGFQ
jgi:hypothetical protein